VPQRATTFQSQAGLVVELTCTVATLPIEAWYFSSESSELQLKELRWGSMVAQSSVIWPPRT